MNLKQLAEHSGRFEGVRTQDLLAILYGDDRDNYSAEDLQAIHRILIGRGLHLPDVPFADGHGSEAPELPEAGEPPDAAIYQPERWGYDHRPHRRGPRYRRYHDVPGYRRSDVNFLCICVHIVSLSIVPLGILSCLTLLTGEIYSKKKDEYGFLKTWGAAKKISVVALLALSFSAGIVLALNALNRPL